MSEDLREFRSVESTHVGRAEIFWGSNPKSGKPVRGERFIHQGKIKTVKHSECFKRGTEPSKGDFIGLSFFHDGEYTW